MTTMYFLQSDEFHGSHVISCHFSSLQSISLRIHILSQTMMDQTAVQIGFETQKLLIMVRPFWETVGAWVVFFTARKAWVMAQHVQTMHIMHWIGISMLSIQSCYHIAGWNMINTTRDETTWAVDLLANELMGLLRSAALRSAPSDLYFLCVKP